jgi:broad specificity phosphatase PhoE
MDCGEADGLLVSEARQRFPAVWQATFTRCTPELRWPGGESYAEFRHRCLDTIGRLAARHPGGRVVAVTHAGLISQVVGFIRGRGSEQWEQDRPGEASLTEISWSTAGSRVHVFDDRGHLA